jgi:glycosyltransferase involved in cell wall biosynthesis
MIVTDVGGLKETIGDRGTGIVASEISPEAISKEILRFFGSEEIRRNCIENIRKEKERLSWKTFAEKLTDFIEQL